MLCPLGTIVDEQEDPAGERVRLAVGAPWAAATYHLVYTSPGADAVRQMPGGTAWLDVIDKFPQRERHLHIHQGHMVEMNDADLAAWRAGGHVSLPSATLTGSADTVGKAVAAMAQAGATEVMYEPSGPDIARELERSSRLYAVSRIHWSHRLPPRLFRSHAGRCRQVR
jgi:5,10-methylenetetrahydromethanopterin reductase